MNEEIKSTTNLGDFEDRIRAFRDCMEPTLHLLPEDIIERLKRQGFFNAPASAAHHGFHEGGLFEHSLNVTRSLVAITEKNGLSWMRPESPYIVGMFHDICKQDQFTMEEILCIRYHMGAFVDKSEWNDYTRAVHLYPNVLWTHTADMIAAHILEIDK